MDRDTPIQNIAFLGGAEAGPRSTRRPAKLLRQEHENGCRRMSNRSSVCKQDKRVGDPQNIDQKITQNNFQSHKEKFEPRITFVLHNLRSDAFMYQMSC